jgi:lipoprotein-anchoring transpeptidase ErfK/SrfK
MQRSNTDPSSNPETLLNEHWARLIKASGDDSPRRWLLVDVQGQRLILAQGPNLILQRPVSTARAGIDCRQDSGGTPSGLHRIQRKIGGDAPPGTVFVGRKPTGQIWAPSPGRESDDLILTRILTLEGCEEGVNRGPGVDSRERFIYIHGTNHEASVGRPVSHGCVRMTNADVMDLFARVEEGDQVLIV